MDFDDIAKPVVSIKGLKKIYKGADQAAVDGLTLDIYSKEIFGMLGPNGAGKTTTISMLCGFFPPTAGSVTIGGMSFAGQAHEIRHFIGVVPQDIALYPTLTAGENLSYIGNMYGLRGKILKQRIDDSLHHFGLSAVKNRKISAFSGGMKRRINLIAGLLHEPKVLILDEPTAGIDVQSRVVILEFLKALNANGTTIIYTSHNMEEAEGLCSRVVIMDHGVSIAVGKPDMLLAGHPEYHNLENLYLHLTGRDLRN
jgi:ABC-2 type transport system ATP-binding protein